MARMSRDKSAIIVGGGIIGVTGAYALAREGSLALAEGRQRSVDSLFLAADSGLDIQYHYGGRDDLGHQFSAWVLLGEIGLIILVLEKPIII